MYYDLASASTVAADVYTNLAGISDKEVIIERDKLMEILEALDVNMVAQITIDDLGREIRDLETKVAYLQEELYKAESTTVKARV